MGQGARTLDRGLMVLETLASSGRRLGVTELSQVCGFDKSTVYRLLTTLVRRGYAQHDPNTRQYSLGLKILELHDALQDSLALQDTVRPFLARLVKETGETSHLAVLSGNEIVFIDWINTEQVVGVRTQIGRREPAAYTALGRAILAALPAGETDAILRSSELRQYTSRTLSSFEELHEDLRRTAERGFAVDNEEFIQGVRCVAAPVRDVAGRAVGALGISGPATRLTVRRCVEIGRVVRDLAESASKSLGYKTSHDGRLRERSEAD